MTCNRVFLLYSWVWLNLFYFYPGHAQATLQSANGRYERVYSQAIACEYGHPLIKLGDGFEDVAYFVSTHRSASLIYEASYDGIRQWNFLNGVSTDDKKVLSVKRSKTLTSVRRDESSLKHKGKLFHLNSAKLPRDGCK